MGSTGCRARRGAQCTAVDNTGGEVTFDPITGTVNTAGVTSIDQGRSLNAVWCSSGTQCTAVDANGHEVTFDPTSAVVNAAGVKSIDPGGASSGWRARRGHNARRSAALAARSRSTRRPGR